MSAAVTLGPGLAPETRATPRLRVLPRWRGELVAIVTDAGERRAVKFAGASRRFWFLDWPMREHPIAFHRRSGLGFYDCEWWRIDRPALALLRGRVVWSCSTCEYFSPPLARGDALTRVGERCAACGAGEPIVMRASAAVHCAPR